MDDNQFKELSSKIDTIIKLLALNSIKEKDPKEQVLTLSAFGFQPKKIAEILGENRATIRGRLLRARKEFEKKQNESDQETS